MAKAANRLICRASPTRGFPDLNRSAVDSGSSIMRNRDYGDHTVWLQFLETITRSSTLLAGG